MPVTTALHRGAVSVIDYRCNAGPHERPYPEQHGAYSISYVRRGSFGCRTQGQCFELVAGSVLIGHPGAEYLCTHDHSEGGDECLSFHFQPEAVETLSTRAQLVKKVWRSGAAPPIAELMVLGELAQAAAEGRSDLSLEELGLALGARFLRVVGGESPPRLDASPRDRKRAINAALWLEERSREGVGLQDAAQEAGLSPYHFLRLFVRVLGVTPHQYLVRCRLRHAARLLAQEELPITEVAFESGFADLSNFVRTFHRAAGISPRGFRASSRGDRKIFQERLAAPA